MDSEEGRRDAHSGFSRADLIFWDVMRIPHDNVLSRVKVACGTSEELQIPRTSWIDNVVA